MFTAENQNSTVSGCKMIEECEQSEIVSFNAFLSKNSLFTLDAYLYIYIRQSAKNKKVFLKFWKTPEITGLNKLKRGE